MVLLYDIEGDDADHDDWHSHEHFRERLSVPGFLRATRWIAEDEGPRNFVIYEVTGTDIATSQPYLDRLNNPTPWTSAMMPRFRGMTRGFCEVVAGAGLGLGTAALVLRFTPAAGTEADFTEGLRTVLPDLTMRRGLVAAHLLRPAPPPPMTREQELRGRDREVPWLVVVSGYDAAALAPLGDLGLTQLGAGAVASGRYRLHHTAIAEEAGR
ncbi:hypothetical protein P1J78_15940 [Psychromarinibacter sp. C21-152]|uniref:Uncharacterized protein n=1 Tax=Psychromarinibacter sediminicola TaxID=3033385 RepID=A0AAE3NUC5_9RHOB|nr:hypothetical protein [Psychromarinibacter sediminicola]MDF0602232.1 hypothetical protein [Psychromarinibacter sediminicola]